MLESQNPGICAKTLVEDTSEKFRLKSIMKFRSCAQTIHMRKKTIGHNSAKMFELLNPTSCARVICDDVSVKVWPKSVCLNRATSSLQHMFWKVRDTQLRTWINTIPAVISFQRLQTLRFSFFVIVVVSLFCQLIPLKRPMFSSSTFRLFGEAVFFEFEYSYLCIFGFHKTKRLLLHAVTCDDLALHHTFHSTAPLTGKNFKSFIFIIERRGQ